MGIGVDYSSCFALIKSFQISVQRVGLTAATVHSQCKADHHKKKPYARWALQRGLDLRESRNSVYCFWMGTDKVKCISLHTDPTLWVPFFLILFLA